MAKIVNRFLMSKSIQGLPMPCPQRQRVCWLTTASQVESFTSSDNTYFASSRDRDLACGEIIGQIGSVFGSSFMADQLSIGMTQAEGQSVDVSQEVLSQMEGYDCVAAVSLHSVMQSNVPLPYAPVNERKVPTHLNMPGSSWRQKAKFTAGDLQDTLYPLECNNDVSEKDSQQV